jgi:type IV secretory pathway TrbF-like protein
MAAPIIPPAGYEYDPTAKRRFVEHYGAAVVTSHYLKIALLCLSTVTVGLLVVTWRTTATLRNVKPLVIRIDDVGRASAVTYTSLEYHPQAQELKYFLIQFVTDHYSRMRANVKNSYARSLYFMDARLADATIDAGKKAKTIERFLTSGDDEVEITVKNVALEDLRTPPYRATVDFEKVYYASDHTETHRETYVGHFEFVTQDKVPNTIVPVNPLGLTITYFREDQAFATNRRGR